MECFYCKGEMKKGKTSHVVNRKGYHLVLDEVPAYICQQCGEAYFDSEGIDLVQAMVCDIDKKAALLQAHG